MRPLPDACVQEAAGYTRHNAVHLFFIASENSELNGAILAIMPNERRAAKPNFPCMQGKFMGQRGRPRPSAAAGRGPRARASLVFSLAHRCKAFLQVVHGRGPEHLAAFLFLEVSERRFH